MTACALTVSALLAAALGTAVLSACGNCDSIVRQTALPVLAAGTFDGVAADQSAHQLYFADRSRQAVDMVDVSGASPRFMGSVDLPDSPNGLAAAPTLHRVYAGMDGGHVAVIDTDRKSQQFMQVVDTVLVDTSATAPTADLMDYSPSRHTLYVATADNGSVVAVDTQTDKVTATFALNTVLEQPRFDPADGKLYVTAPHIDSLLQLDPATGKVLRTYRVPAPPRPLPRPTAGQPTPAARQSPVLSGCRPTGLGINPSRQLALVACRG
ncbi:MAG TPA: hypothetical protein VFK22_01840, partial [Candidatus Dormibacteraeota bacterium]|nr:hypothetical protein [Candidatus Dormibacteraeota bacterium]